MVVVKKLLVLAAALGGIIILNKKWQDSKSQKATWSNATDSVK